MKGLNAQFNKFSESMTMWRTVYQELFYRDLRLKEEQITELDEYQLEILTSRMTIYLVFAEDFRSWASLLKQLVLLCGALILGSIGVLHTLNLPVIGGAIGVFALLPALKAYFFLRDLIYDTRWIQNFVGELADNENVQDYLHYKINKGKPVM